MNKKLISAGPVLREAVRERYGDSKPITIIVTNCSAKLSEAGSEYYPYLKTADIFVFITAKRKPTFIAHIREFTDSDDLANWEKNILYSLHGVSESRSRIKIVNKTEKDCLERVHFIFDLLRDNGIDIRIAENYAANSLYANLFALAKIKIWEL